MVQNGQSVDSDTISFKFADNGVEIENWIDYYYNQDFLKPTVEWSFTIDAEDSAIRDTLVFGVGVNIYLNNYIQCSGIIERVTTEISPTGGSLLRIQGRDIMAIVVESHVDPQLAFPTNTTLQNVVKTVLASLGITKIDNSDSINLNVLTGKKYAPDEDAGFTKRQLKELKTQYGEGAWQFLDKLLKRQGFMMWSRADGTGVVISQPNWTNNSGMNITHSVSSPKVNNVLHGTKMIDATEQPLVLVCKGMSNGLDSTIVATDIIMLNELVALDYQGIPLPQVSAIIAKYQEQGAFVMPYRDVLIPQQQSIYQKPIVRGPFFIKDKEAQDSAQLQNFVKRTMAHYQYKFTSLHYTVKGHTQSNTVAAGQAASAAVAASALTGGLGGSAVGIGSAIATAPGFTPWAVNTLVNIDDEVLDIHEPYWLLSRTFRKSDSEGTVTDLHLIKPYTLDISTFGNKGTQTKVGSGSGGGVL